MKTLLLGIALGIILTLAGEFLCAIGGGLPVATSAPPLPLEKYIAHKAIHAKVDPEASRPCPLPADEVNLQKGAQVYQAQCALCHGDPGRPMSPVAKGMFPLPPELLKTGKKPDDSPIGGIYWRVKNGIRLTGMPGYERSLTEAEMWQVSLLLKNADRLPPSAKAVLAGP